MTALVTGSSLSCLLLLPTFLALLACFLSLLILSATSSWSSSGFSLVFSLCLSLPFLLSSSGFSLVFSLCLSLPFLLSCSVLLFSNVVIDYSCLPWPLTNHVCHGHWRDSGGGCAISVLGWGHFTNWEAEPEPWLRAPCSIGPGVQPCPHQKGDREGEASGLSWYSD